MGKGLADGDSDCDRELYSKIVQYYLKTWYIKKQPLALIPNSTVRKLTS